MHLYLTRFLVCFLFVLPSWLAGAVQNMATVGDLVVAAGFAASLAWVLGLAGPRPAAIEPVDITERLPK